MIGLTTEYVWGPKQMESGVVCDGYKLMEYLKRFNLNHYELTCWMPEPGIDGIKSFLNENPEKKIISIHAYAPLGEDFVLGNHPADGFNPASCNEKKRVNAVSRLKNTIDLASQLGAKYVVVHGGQKEINQERRSNLDSLLYSVEESLDFIDNKGYDIKIGVENGVYPSSIFVNSDEISKIKRFYPKAGLWFDSGHANVNKNSDTLRISEECKDLVIGFHIHNNNGYKDLHNPTYRGKINFSEFFKPFAENIRKEDMPIILELYSFRSNIVDSEVAESLNHIKKIIY